MAFFVTCYWLLVTLSLSWSWIRIIFVIRIFNNFVLDSPVNKALWNWAESTILFPGRRWGQLPNFLPSVFSRSKKENSGNDHHSTQSGKKLNAFWVFHFIPNFHCSFDRFFLKCNIGAFACAKLSGIVGRKYPVCSTSISKKSGSASSTGETGCSPFVHFAVLMIRTQKLSLVFNFFNHSKMFFYIL